MAGNPDQQEDTLDEQYQEEVEDEVCETDTCVTCDGREKSNAQSYWIYFSFNMSKHPDVSVNFYPCCPFHFLKAQEDIAGGQKREDVVEEEGEDPYNEDNIEQVGSSGGSSVALKTVCVV